MERLFGRKSKKPSNSNASPVVTNEDEGFAIVNPPPPLPSSTTPYPILNPTVTANTSTAPPYTTSGTGSSASGGGSNSAFLDGIPFALSSKCQGGSGSDLDEVLARVETIAERVRSVDWSSTDYDFRLEKSVLSQEISNSLQQVHME